MNQIILLTAQQLNRATVNEQIQQQFGFGRADSNLLDHWHPGRAMDVYIFDMDILAEVVGDQIDPIAKLRKCVKTMQNTEWGAAWLKKGLRRYHQDLHHLLLDA
jgi:hypothetical protein